MPPSLNPQLVLTISFVLAMCLTVWAWVVVRFSLGRAVIPFCHRRPVPWSGWVVMVFLAPSMVSVALAILLPPAPPQKAKQPKGAAAAVEKNEHPVIRLWKSDPRVVTRLVLVVTAAIVAPLVEEFLFRLLLQGWLEAADRRWRRRFRRLRSLVPGVLPVVTVAALFAAIHYRGSQPDPDPPIRIQVLLGNAAVGLVTVAVGVAWLRRGGARRSPNSVSNHGGLAATSPWGWRRLPPSPHPSTSCRGYWSRGSRRGSPIRSACFFSPWCWVSCTTVRIASFRRSRFTWR